MLLTAKPSHPLIALIIIVCCLFHVTSCTIVPDEEKTAEGQEKLDIYFVSDDFKPDDYAEKVWDDKVITLFEEKSHALEDVLPLWHKDQQAAGSKFGYREKAEGSPWNYRVRGTGIVVKVNTESRASTIDIDLLPGDNSADLSIQIGPVIKDSAIRDSLDFISFTDFTNQLEFARLSNAFNKLVNKKVVGDLDRENLMGKKISFWGAYTQLQDSDLIRLTPVILKIE
ncbi:MAG: DUF2291 domain-containing protein [Desulfobulbaceae bacterium]|nr:MAG: DUF2291 domain-containing protein [Desulfobulbaceae bacterium]